MTIALDFDAVEVTGNAQNIPATVSYSDPATVATLATILLASASWPLQTGRVVLLDVEFLAQDSAGEVYMYSAKLLIPPSGYYGASTLGTSYTGYGCPGGGALTLDGSGDLLIQWANNNLATSGITQDASVRAKVRWLGS